MVTIASNCTRQRTYFTRVRLRFVSDATTLPRYHLIPNKSVLRVGTRHFSSSRRRLPRRKELSFTKKDRIRLHKKPPEKSLPGVFVSPEKAGDVLASRLTQARSTLFQFWSEGTTGSRPPRRGPTMDARWWFWNICLALMPATLIGLYCEFVAQEEMHEFFRELEQQQQRRIMGADYVEADHERQDPVVPKGFGPKAKEAMRELRALSENMGETTGVDETTPQDQTTPPARDEAGGGNTAEASTNDGKERSPPKDKPHISDRDMLLVLHHRLETLESELQKRQRGRDHQHQYQMERMQQSGIRNRMEDRMVNEWQQEKQEQATNEQENKTLTDKMKEAAWVGLRQNVSARKEAMERYGIEIMDRAWGFWDSADDEKNEEAAVHNDIRTEPVTKSSDLSTGSETHNRTTTAQQQKETERVSTMKHSNGSNPVQGENGVHVVEKQADSANPSTEDG